MSEQATARETRSKDIRAEFAVGKLRSVPVLHDSLLPSSLCFPLSYLFR